MTARSLTSHFPYAKTGKNQSLHSRSSSLFLREVLQGLQQRSKTLPCKYFYDAEGSRLFAKICEQPEYYLTRTETALLACIAPELGKMCGPDVEILELGSGAGEKIRILLNALSSPRAYIPTDISREILHESARQLQQEFPDINITPRCLDYMQPAFWKKLAPMPGKRRIVFFPGSTLGNFSPEEALLFLRRLGKLAGRQGGIVVGVDLQKDITVLEHAYNDAKGITAAFNLNLLRRIRRELQADIPVQYFSHRALYNAVQNRIEMHLVSRQAHLWSLGGKTISFEKNETIHTESSYKYTVEGFQTLARHAGLKPLQVWKDEKAWFSIHFLESAIP